jgi:hypothetical protein
VFDGRTILQLQDALELRRAKVMGEFRLELSGFSDGMVERLKAVGLRSEIISWKLRLFVPTAASGPTILAKLMERHPLVRVAAKGGGVRVGTMSSQAAELARRLARDAEAVFPAGIAQGEMPPLFIVGAKGETPELVNYLVRANHMIVDWLFAAAELRLGDGHSERRVSCAPMGDSCGDRQRFRSAARRCPAISAGRSEARSSRCLASPPWMPISSASPRRPRRRVQAASLPALVSGSTPRQPLRCPPRSSQ